MKNITILTAIVTIIFFYSCKSKEEKELDKIADYIEEHNVTTQPTSSGLYYIETKVGTGVQAKSGDMVKVHYTGTFIDGKKFDSSVDRGEPFEFKLGQGNVIAGWDEGIAYMKKGGKAQLIIPSSLGYGSNGYRSIPGYATLLFDIELIDIQ